jgi:hypothetical protein
MPYTDEGKNLMLEALRKAASHVGLHTAYPKEQNSEVPFGIYRRASISFALDGSGAMESNNKVLFEVPPNTRVRFVGFWDRAVGGILLAFDPLPTEMHFKGRGVAVLDLAHMDLNYYPQE